MIEFNPLDPENQANPYAHFAALRAADPVHWSELFEGWVLTRYREVRAVLRDPATFSSDRTRSRLLGAMTERLPEKLRLMDSSMVFCDDPDHGRRRGLVDKAFAPRCVAAIGPALEREARSRVAAMLDRDVDWMESFAHPVPAAALGLLLGIPEEHHPLLLTWTRDLGWLSTPIPFLPQSALQRIETSGLEMLDYLSRLFAERRREPREDLISALVRGGGAGDRLSQEELYVVVSDILIAGHSTTAHALGSSLCTLLEHPAERASVELRGELLPAAIDECLRLESPLQLTLRVASRDTSLGGRDVRQGDALLCMLGAANRDPAIFSDPDTFDLYRKGPRHLAFGDGKHFCLGASLARRTLQIALAVAFEDAHFELRKARWSATFVNRGLDGLRVRVSRRAGAFSDAA